MMCGIVRKFDELGRITIPKEMRKYLNLEDRAEMDIYLKDGVICIAPYRLKCVDCGSTDENNLINLNGKMHCRDCAVDMAVEMTKYGLI